MGQRCIENELILLLYLAPIVIVICSSSAIICIQNTVDRLITFIAEAAAAALAVISECVAEYVAN